MQHKPAHPDFPSPRLSPQALSPQTQECALVAEEYSINWASLLNPHCAPDPVLGLDKRVHFIWCWWVGGRYLPTDFTEIEKGVCRTLVVRMEPVPTNVAQRPPQQPWAWHQRERGAWHGAARHSTG